MSLIVTIQFQLYLTAPPVFKKTLDNIQMKEDSTVKFVAEIHGNPSPEIQWFKDDQLVMEGEGLQISQESNFYKLTISGSEKDDSGKYAIAATNCVGNAKSQAELVVGNPPLVKNIKKKDFYISGLEMKVDIEVKVHD